MIQNIELLTKSNSKSLDFQLKSNTVTFDSNLEYSKPLTLKFIFKEPILYVRDYNYTWAKPHENYLASELCPKIIKLQSGVCIQANLIAGAWQLSSHNKYELYWLFNQKNQYPYTQYRKPGNHKHIISHKKVTRLSDLKLLITNSPLEISRSKIGFTSVICFTDHCDFDTPENLTTLREFFKKYDIKVTKGFFLNHYSKRQTNASFENNSLELKKWQDDGHELAYHSLTQSIKSKEKAIYEFENFEALNKTATWIDHGYQPYNFSCLQSSGFSKNQYLNLLKSKNIKYLWTYIDNTSAHKGIINQLDFTSFKLKTLLKATEKDTFVKRWSLVSKAILFYYYNSSKTTQAYKSIAGIFKKLKKRFNIKDLLSFIQVILKIIYWLFIPLIFKQNRNKVYPLSYYKPTIFQFNSDFYMFQTIEMNDFVNGLCKHNQDQMIKNKGFALLHTYFSVDFSYHKGRLLKDNNKINPEAEETFKIFCNNIQASKLWNPTFKELMQYIQPLFNSELKLDADNKVVFAETNHLLTRYIS